MDLLPDAAGPAALAVLALVDSTSMGTLVIPLILLLVGAGSARRTAAATAWYLLVIGAFYLLLGIALLAGLLPLATRFGHLASTPQVQLLGAFAGAGLLVWSFRTDPKAIAKRGGDPEASARRWTERARRAVTSPRLLLGLALAAGVIEAASMLPYLAAMGILSSMQVGIGEGALYLLGYCLLMILPGLLLCAVRALLGARADALLDRAHARAVRYAADAFSWVIGILGVLLLLHTLPPTLAWLTG